MNYYRLPAALLLAASLGLGACESPEPAASTGHHYIHHIKNEGQRPAPGDYAYCDIDLKRGDHLVTSSRASGKLARILLTEPSDGEIDSPVVAALRMMSEGDSLSLFYRIDTLASKPKGFEYADVIRYDIVLRAVKSAAEYGADFQAQWKRATASLDKFP